MDYNPRDTIDNMAAGNRSKHQQDIGTFHSHHSDYPAPARRASSESRLDVIHHHQDFLKKIEAKPSIEEEPAILHTGSIYRQEPVASEESIVDMPSDEEALNVRCLLLETVSLGLYFFTSLETHCLLFIVAVYASILGGLVVA